VLNRNHTALFTDDSLWEKLTKFGKAAGREMVERVLTMYYAFRDEDTPVWAKTILVSALAYFVCPIDAIPDVIPGAGYADDGGAIAVALGTVAVHIKEGHRQRARERTNGWFS
jgi:uncharacterized membrane protein YkvA (DUF1232 family)